MFLAGCYVLRFACCVMVVVCRLFVAMLFVVVCVAVVCSWLLCAVVVGGVFCRRCPQVWFAFVVCR